MFHLLIAGLRLVGIPQAGLAPGVCRVLHLRVTATTMSFLDVL